MSFINLFEGVLGRIGATPEEIQELFQSEAPKTEFFEKYKSRLDGLMTLEAAKSNDALHQHFTGSSLSGVDAGIMKEARERYADIIPAERFDQIDGAKSIQNKVIAIADELSKAYGKAKSSGTANASEQTKAFKAENEELRSKLAAFESKFNEQAKAFEDERINTAIRNKMAGLKFKTDDPKYHEFLRGQIIQEIRGKAKLIRSETGALIPMSKTIEGQPYYTDDNHAAPATLEALINKAAYPYLAKSAPPATPPKEGNPPQPPTRKTPNNSRAEELIRRNRERAEQAINK